jgi:molybdopterin synthase catalytic subunit
VHRQLASISGQPLDAAALESQVWSREHGALVTFRGIVRDHDHGQAVTALDYQAHPDALGFLQACLDRLELPAAAAHRVGSLTIGDVALVAVVAAGHRGEAFAACERLVDDIKATVPIWKRQHLADGVTEWVGL